MAFKLGILLIAIGPYKQLIGDLIRSCEAMFFPSLPKYYFIFTDDPINLENPPNVNGTLIRTPTTPWPYPTLNRFEYVTTIGQNLIKAKSISNLFFFNANCRFIQLVDDTNILESPIVACQHPGHVSTHFAALPFERRQRSTAYIELRPDLKYLAGGLQGGLLNDFLAAYDDCRRLVQIDLKTGTIATWNDESYWNYLLAKRHYERVLILDASHLYPEGWNLDLSPKILLLDKRRIFNANKPYF